MAAIILPPRTLPSPGDCDCSAPSPTYHPKFESLSDVDLQVLETLGYLGIAGPADLSCASIREIAAPADCWACLSSRRREELVVSAFGDPGPINELSVRQALEAIERCLTPDQLAGLLDYAKYQYILGNFPT